MTTKDLTDLLKGELTNEIANYIKSENPFPETMINWLSELILLMCVIFSIAFSIFLFLVLGEEMLALFIGLWAPTIMSLINYINIKFKK